VALDFTELFGYAPLDEHPNAQAARENSSCPFVGNACQKQFRDGTPSGSCTLKPSNAGPVICCPQRLYADDYRILRDISDSAFGPGHQLVNASDISTSDTSGSKVAVFGKRWGKELRLPNRRETGGYFVDWILALLNDDGTLDQFVAAEVQTIDTTGSYRKVFDAYMAGEVFEGRQSGGFNWENVSKRILPQLIYKGHVLRREPLCRKGLYFICPEPVYERIKQRLGGSLLEYEPQPGSLTFMWYNIGPEAESGTLRGLKKGGSFTTTVDQVVNAFASPTNFPEPKVYEDAIRKELERCRQ